MLCIQCGETAVKQETQLMLKDPRYAFRGQSRSPNMVPFNMIVRYGFLLACYSNFVPKRGVFQTLDFKKCHDLEIRVTVTQGH